VRLRDLAPHLSHAARARLALDRITDHVDALDRARAQAHAHAFLASLHEPIAEFTPTVVTTTGDVFGPGGPPAVPAGAIRRHLRAVRTTRN
jgi:hypothetical protein